MSIPNDNPSLPNSVNPYFQDNAFVQGDQLRNNNALIWGNLEFLDSEITAVIDALPFRSYQLITASTTWINPDPTTIKKLFVKAVGGGGGGAGSSNSGAASNYGGGGGASGVEVSGIISVGGSQVITIGTGGSGGGLNSVGSAGGSTVVGAVTAVGGNGGGTPGLLTLAGRNTARSFAGTNGIKNQGDSLNITGGDGGGAGGGRGGFSSNSPTNGVFGGGGGGAIGGGSSGANGGDGFVEIWY